MIGGIEIMKNFVFLALSASLLTFGVSASSSPALADSVLDKVIKNKEIFEDFKDTNIFFQNSSNIFLKNFSYLTYFIYV